jgi:hypothetical protein
MKATPKRKVSNHYWTRARLAAAAIAKMAAGETIAATALWNRIDTRDTRPIYNQRQIRKQRRQRFAAGDRHAFA